MLLSDQLFPNYEIRFGGKNADREPEAVAAAEFIGLKSFKARGKRLSKYEIKKVLESDPTEATDELIAAFYGEEFLNRLSGNDQENDNEDETEDQAIPESAENDEEGGDEMMDPEDQSDEDSEDLAADSEEETKQPPEATEPDKKKDKGGSSTHMTLGL